MPAEVCGLVDSAWVQLPPWYTRMAGPCLNQPQPRSHLRGASRQTRHRLARLSVSHKIASSSLPPYFPMITGQEVQQNTVKIQRPKSKSTFRFPRSSCQLGWRVDLIKVCEVLLWMCFEDPRVDLEHSTIAEYLLDLAFETCSPEHILAPYLFLTIFAYPSSDLAKNELGAPIHMPIHLTNLT